MTDEVEEQVLDETIRVSELPWEATPALTAGLRVGVLRTGLWERVLGLKRGVLRRPWEVALITSRGNSFVFDGSASEEAVMRLCNLLADLPGAQLTQALTTTDMQDQGSRSGVLLTQWLEICYAWTRGRFLPGDVVVLDSDYDTDAVDGPITVHAGCPFEVLDVPLEEERMVLGKTDSGDVLSFPIEKLSLLAERPDGAGRKRDAQYAYQPGAGYVEIQGGTR